MSKLKTKTKTKGLKKFPISADSIKRPFTLSRKFTRNFARLVYSNILRGGYAKLKGNIGEWESWQREGMFTSRRWCTGL